jgi:hypothetical protein
MVLLASVLMACGDNAPLQSLGDSRPVDSEETPGLVSAQSVGTVPGPEPAEPLGDHSSTEATAVVKDAPVTSGPSSAQAEPEPAPRLLDLGYKSDPQPVQSEQDKAFAQDRQLLPNLFDQGKSAKKISVSGGVVLDHQQRELRELRESVTGGELTVEIKTP